MSKKSKAIIGAIVFLYGVIVFFALYGMELEDKSLSQYLFLCGTLLIASFSIITAIKCYVNNLDNKWIWIIIILFGIGRLELNWNLGTFDWDLVSISIPSFNFIKTYSDNMIRIVLCIPFGLIIYYIKLLVKGKSMKTSL